MEYFKKVSLVDKFFYEYSEKKPNSSLNLNQIKQNQKYNISEEKIKKAEQQAEGYCKIWGVTKLTRKQITTKYVRYEGILENEKIILKSYYKQNEALAEEIGIENLQKRIKVPKLLGAGFGVLALEKIEQDATVEAESCDIQNIIENLYKKQSKYSATWNYVPSWEEVYIKKLQKITDIYKEKLPHFLEKIHETTSKIPELLKQENRLIHGKIIKENIIVNAKSEYCLVNPEPIISPLGWEVAVAIVDYGSKGNNTTKICEAAEELKIDQMESWVKLASLILLATDPE